MSGHLLVSGAMDYEDLENFTLVNMLEDEDMVQDIHLDSKFNLMNRKSTSSIVEEDESQGYSVFCEQTVRTCADMVGMNIERLSDKEIVHIADDISYLVMDVIQSCKRHLMMTKQSRLTPKILKEILASTYGYKCYGLVAHQQNEVDKNTEESIQKQCEKQFVQVGNSKSKKLYINNDVILSCMDVEVITYCNAPFYISQSWMFPSEEFMKNPHVHLDKQYYRSILGIVLSPHNIPFIKLVNEFDINRVALKLVNCVLTTIKEFAKKERILNRLLDFLIALANSKYLLSPAYTYVCFNLLRLAVAISTKEFVSDGQTLPLSYSIRRKAAALVADMVKHWDIGPHFIMDVTTRVNQSTPEYKELLSHSGAVSILSALGRDIFKYSIFFHIADLFAHIKELHTSRIQGAQKDRRLMQRFYQDVCYVRDALFHAIYQLYKNNFIDTTSRLHSRCLDGDLRASGYFGDLALLIRHDNHNSPFKSSALKVFDPELVIDVAFFDEDSQRIKTEQKATRYKRDKDADDLNSLLHIGVTPVSRSNNYSGFDNDIVGPILKHFSEHLRLNSKDRQLLVDDIYYRCMHILLQATPSISKKKGTILTLTDLRASLLTFYPSHFVRPLSRKDVCSEFEDYKFLPQGKRPRIRIQIANCMRKPEYKLKRSVSYSRNTDYYQEELSTHYRHQVYCRRKNIKDLNFDYKQNVCSSLLSVML